MSNIDDSDFDTDFGMDIDEATFIRIQPSIQTSALYPSNKNLGTINKFQNSFLTADCIHSHQASRTTCSVENSKKSQNSLFEEPQLSQCLKTEPHSLPKRLYSFKQKVDQKVKTLIKQKEDYEIKECSFKPAILNNTKRRSIQTFLKHMEYYSDKKKIQIKKIQEENKVLEESQDNKIKLSKGTVQILSAKTIDKPKPTEKFFVNREKNPVPTFLFQPVINENSKKITKKTGSDLRLEETKGKLSASKSPCSPKPKVFLSPRSEKVLIKKFNTEFNKVISEVNFEGIELLNYTKFCQIFYKMGFTTSNTEKFNDERELILKAWKYLDADHSNKVDKNDLNIFLLGIMNLSSNSRKLSNDMIKNHKVQSNFKLNSLDPKDIHKKFYLFCMNRKNQTKPEFERKTFTQKSLSPVESRKKRLHSAPSDLKSSEEPVMKTSEAKEVLKETPKIEFSILSSPKNLMKTPESNQLNSNDSYFRFSALSDLKESPEHQTQTKFNMEPTKLRLSIPNLESANNHLFLRSISLSPDHKFPKVRFSVHSSPKNNIETYSQLFNM